MKTRTWWRPLTNMESSSSRAGYLGVESLAALARLEALDEMRALTEEDVVQDDGVDVILDSITLLMAADFAD